MTEEQIDVLVIYSSFGTGHLQVARTVKDYLARLHPEWKIECVDQLDVIRSPIQNIGRKLYNRMDRLYRPLYAFGYYITKNVPMGNWTKKAGRIYDAKMFGEYIARRMPRLIVSVFPAVNGACALLKNLGMNIPIASIVTDAAVHAEWLYREVSLYFVMDEKTREGCIKYGIEPERIFATGIPTRTIFEKQYDRAETRRKYGMDPDLPALMISAGGMGFIDTMKTMVRHAQETELPIQVVLITGRNQKAMQIMKEYAKEAKIKIILPGYVENMAEMMQACDAILTKPGGLTMSEVLVCGLPMIAYDPVPGQETANLRFLTQHGAARHLKSCSQMKQMLEDVLFNEETRRSMREACLRIGCPKAGQISAEKMAALVEEVEE